MEPHIISTQTTDTALYLSKLSLFGRFCKLAANHLHIMTSKVLTVAEHSSLVTLHHISWPKSWTA